jgi:alpha-L-fucosidase
MKKLPALIILTCLGFAAFAQEHEMSADYIVPTDELVLQKLSAWQDLKFGLFMHWGTYSQWGVVESWSICPEDEGWTQRRGPYAASYNDYKKAYENLQRSFNPTHFDPAKWATAAKNAGMKYVVLTTKHHDGFCMFDTKETDYKITSSNTPFSSNPNSNVTKAVFDAFRKENFMVGAYFSKPDWHDPNYWWSYFPPKDRNVNYDPKKYPEKWQAFKQFTFNQISELMTGYGKVDILWLDGGWVRPFSTINKNIDWQRTIPYDQDIDMAGIAAMGRAKQPGLVVVDRSVGGAFENYFTPEQTIPAKPLGFPWESCITMGGSWSYVPGDTYKSSNELVHMLVKIVSRGGNFLLNIGPSPDGDFSDTAYSRLQEIGRWMKVHGEGIYGTIPFAPYEQDNLVYLQSKNKQTIYVDVLSAADGSVHLPENILIPGALATPKTRVICLDAPTIKLKVIKKSGGIYFDIPMQLMAKAAGFRYATSFKISL